MLHGRAISGNVRAINFRVRKFGQKSDTRRTVSHDKILHRTSVCAVSEAFKAAILKEAVRQNANSGGKVEKKEIRACRAEKHKKRTCK